MTPDAQREYKKLRAREWRARQPADELRRRSTEASRLWRHKHREAFRAYRKAYDSQPHVLQKKRAYQLQYRADPSRRIACLIRNAKHSGRDIDLEFLGGLQVTPPEACACCGKALDYSAGRGKNNREDSPSLDRRDNSLGYLAGNVFIICFRCNGLKSDASADELETIAAYIRRPVQCS